jgi:penicillin-binding protein 2
MTFLYDREKAMNVLTDLEKSWGGTIQERMDKKMAAYRAKIELEKAIAENRVPMSPETKEAPDSGVGE